MRLSYCTPQPDQPRAQIHRIKRIRFRQAQQFFRKSLQFHSAASTASAEWFGRMKPPAFGHHPDEQTFSRQVFSMKTDDVSNSLPRRLFTKDLLSSGKR